MNTKCSNLDSLFADFEKAGIDTNRLNDFDLLKIKEVCEDKDCILWLVDHKHLSSVYMNTYGRDYFGFNAEKMIDFAFSDLLQVTNADDVHLYNNSITHFMHHPDQVFNMCVRMKDKRGEWKWVYYIQKAMNFDASGFPQNMMSMIVDVEGLLRNTPSNNGTNAAYLEKQKRYKLLTNREREVLSLVAEEMTSQEIANKLFIETSTVDTHRKHIIRKLNVRSSLGLVQYALFFSEAV